MSSGTPPTKAPRAFSSLLQLARRTAAPSAASTTSRTDTPTAAATIESESAEKATAATAAAAAAAIVTAVSPASTRDSTGEEDIDDDEGSNNSGSDVSEPLSEERRREQRIETARSNIVAQQADIRAALPNPTRFNAGQNSSVDAWRFEELVWTESHHNGAFYLSVLDAAGIDIGTSAAGASADAACNALNELIATAMPAGVAAIRTKRVKEWYAAAKARGAKRDAADAATMHTARTRSAARANDIVAAVSPTCIICSVTVGTLQQSSAALRRHTTSASHLQCADRFSALSSLDAHVVVPIVVKLTHRMEEAAQIMTRLSSAISAAVALGNGGGKGCLTGDAHALVAARRTRLQTRLDEDTVAAAALLELMNALSEEIERDGAWRSIEVTLPVSDRAAEAAAAGSRSKPFVREIRPRDVRIRMVPSRSPPSPATASSSTSAQGWCYTLAVEDEDACSSHPVARLLRVTQEGESLLRWRLHPLISCLEAELERIPGLQGGASRLADVRAASKRLKRLRKAEDSRRLALQMRPSSDGSGGPLDPRLASLGPIPGALFAPSRVAGAPYVTPATAAATASLTQNGGGGDGGGGGGAPGARVRQGRGRGAPLVSSLPGIS